MRTEKSPQQAQSLPVQGWALEPQPQTTLNKYQVSIDNHLLLLQLHIFQIRETSSVRFTWAYRHVAKCVYWFYLLSCYLFLACCQDVTMYLEKIATFCQEHECFPSPEWKYNLQST